MDPPATLGIGGREALGYRQGWRESRLHPGNGNYLKVSRGLGNEQRSEAHGDYRMGSLCARLGSVIFIYRATGAIRRRRAGGGVVQPAFYRPLCPQ